MHPLQGRHLLGRWRHAVQPAVAHMRRGLLLRGRGYGPDRPRVHGVQAGHLRWHHLALALLEPDGRGLRFEAERLVPGRHLLRGGLLGDG